MKKRHKHSQKFRQEDQAFSDLPDKNANSTHKDKRDRTVNETRNTIKKTRPKSKSTKPKGLWLYGTHAVLAALENPKRDALRLLLTEEALQREGEKIERAISNSGRKDELKTEIVSRDVLENYLPDHAVHQGIALLAKPLATLAIEDILQMPAPQGKKSVIVALDQVTDPHNVGAILRTTAAFEGLAVLAPTHHAAMESGTLAKTSTGAIEHVPYVTVPNLVAALKKAKDDGFWCIGLDAAAKQSLGQMMVAGDLPDKIILVMGAEGHGMRRLTLETCDFLAKLPTSGKIKDLNVSNATAISLFILLGQAER